MISKITVVVKLKPHRGAEQGRSDVGSVSGHRHTSVLPLFHWLVLGEMPCPASGKDGKCSLAVILGRRGNGSDEQLASLCFTLLFWLCISGVCVLYLQIYLC